MSNPSGEQALGSALPSILPSASWPSLGPSSSPPAARLGSEFEIHDLFRSALKDTGARGACGAGLVRIPSAPLSHSCPCMG